MAVKKNETPDKNKALENAIKQITKDFGEGSIMKLGENSAMNIDAVSYTHLRAHETVY